MAKKYASDKARRDARLKSKKQSYLRCASLPVVYTSFVLRLLLEPSYLSRHQVSNQEKARKRWNQSRAQKSPATASGLLLRQQIISSARRAEITEHAYTVERRLDEYENLIIHKEATGWLFDTLDICMDKIRHVNGDVLMRTTVWVEWIRLGYSVKELVFDPWLKDIEKDPRWQTLLRVAHNNPQ